MKLFFRIIFKIFLIITISAGCASAAEIKETDSNALLNQGIEINPRYAEFYNNRGLVYEEKGQYDKAISYYNKAIELNPRYAKAYNNRGNAYYKKGQYEKTISDYSKAIEINPRFAEAYNNRAVAYFYKRNYEKTWDDVYKAQNLGYKVHPGFLNALRQASGREK
jgi:tetratricopeptide (TPR) repeat protein